MSNNTLLVLLPIIPILGVVWYFALSGPSSTVGENTVVAVDKPVVNNDDELEEYYKDEYNKYINEPEIADELNYAYANGDVPGQYDGPVGGKSKNKRSKSKNKHSK